MKIILKEGFIVKLCLCITIAGITLLFAVSENIDKTGIEAVAAPGSGSAKFTAIVSSVQQNENAATMWVTANLSAKVVVYKPDAEFSSFAKGDTVIIKGLPRRENGVVIIDADEIIKK